MSIATYSRQSVHRLRVLEAALALSAAGVLLKLLPFRWTMKLIRSRAASAGEGRTAQAAGHDLMAGNVGRAVYRAAVRLPWHSACLAKALAGHVMLARRGVASTVVLGVAKNVDGLRAHAWLLTGGWAVCGGREAPDYTPLAVFEKTMTP